jgi:hypothetical protein
MAASNEHFNVMLRGFPKSVVRVEQPSRAGPGIMEMTGDGLMSMAQEEVGKPWIYHDMPKAENLDTFGTNGGQVWQEEDWGHLIDMMRTGFGMAPAEWATVRCYPNLWDTDGVKRDNATAPNGRQYSHSGEVPQARMPSPNTRGNSLCSIPKKSRRPNIARHRRRETSRTSHSSRTVWRAGEAGRTS